MSFKRFLQDYHNFEGQLFTGDTKSHLGVEAYPSSVAASLTCGIEKMSQSSCELISILAFVDPDSVDLDLFRVTTQKM
jgi:hypothetical protein